MRLVQARLFWDYPQGFCYLASTRAVRPPAEHHDGVPVSLEVLEGELCEGSDWLARVIEFDLTPEREDFVNFLDVQVRLAPEAGAALTAPLTAPLPALLLSADAPVIFSERSGMIDWDMELRDWHHATLLLASPGHPLCAAYSPDPQQVCAGRFYNRRGRWRG